MTRYDIARMCGYNSPEEYDEAQRRLHESYVERKKREESNVEKEPVKIQPVNQWISIKDRLPDEDGWYLVYKHNRVRVAEWCKDCWYNESDLPIDDCAITHWQLLPEPPKDGDING